MRKKFILSEAEAMAGYVRAVLAGVRDDFVRWKLWERRAERLAEQRTGGPALADACREVDLARDAHLQSAEELEALGLHLLDPVAGVAGFPFRWSRSRRSRRIRKAYFLLKLEDDADHGIQRWRFRGETEERRVPPHWLGQMQSPIVAEVGV